MLLFVWDKNMSLISSSIILWSHLEQQILVDATKLFLSMFVSKLSHLFENVVICALLLIDTSSNLGPPTRCPNHVSNHRGTMLQIK